MTPLFILGTKTNENQLLKICSIFVIVSSRAHVVTRVPWYVAFNRIYRNN